MLQLVFYLRVITSALSEAIQYMPQKELSCNVITNAGSLMSAELGLFVDRARLTFRFGAAPTRGFEKYVGNRTSGRIVGNSRTAGLMKNSSVVRGVRLFLIRERTMHQCPSLMKAAGIEVICLVLDGEKYLKAHFTGGRDPSTGFWATFWLRLLCDEITAFGFCNPSSLYFYHYFQTKIDGKEKSAVDGRAFMAGRMQKKRGHDFVHEREVLEQWSLATTTINHTTVRLLKKETPATNLTGRLWNRGKKGHTREFLLLRSISEVRQVLLAHSHHW